MEIPKLDLSRVRNYRVTARKVSSWKPCGYVKHDRDVVAVGVEDALEHFRALGLPCEAGHCVERPVPERYSDPERLRLVLGAVTERARQVLGV